MTPIEFSVYLTAYASNQPQPGTHPDWTHTRRDGLALAKYWAANAVFAIRGSVAPTQPEINALFNEFYEANQRQREAM